MFYHDIIYMMKLLLFFIYYYYCYYFYYFTIIYLLWNVIIMCIYILYILYIIIYYIFICYTIIYIYISYIDLDNWYAVPTDDSHQPHPSNPQPPGCDVCSLAHHEQYNPQNQSPIKSIYIIPQQQNLAIRVRSGCDPVRSGAASTPGSGKDSGGFCCRYFVRFRRVPVKIPAEAPEGSVRFRRVPVQILVRFRKFPVQVLGEVPEG